MALAESGPAMLGEQGPMLCFQELMYIPLMGVGGGCAAVCAAVLVVLSSKGRATSGYKSKREGF